MTLLTDADRREADQLGERIRQMHRIPDSADKPLVSPEEAESWPALVGWAFVAVLAIGAALLNT